MNPKQSHSPPQPLPPAQPPNFDAVIAGAGPAGSSMAAWLAAQGWSVLLVEREQLPRHKVCGEFLSPEAQTTLAAQGVYESVAALHPVPLTAANLTAPSGSALAITLPGEAWGISRYALDAALAAAAKARGAEVWYGTTLTGWHEVEGAKAGGAGRNFSVELRRATVDLTTVRTRALLVACGRHGLARLLPHSAARGVARPAQNAAVGIKCHFANLAMPAQVELYLFEGGYIGVNPIENGCANVCALASYSAFARAGRSPRALIEAAARWNPAFGRRVLPGLALPETECAVAPVDARHRAAPWQGLPLLGDTAAMIPPLCGDGMAMALRSAELCAPLVNGYLRSACTWAELGSRYSALWQAEFGARLRTGRRLEALLLSPRASEWLLKVGKAFPALADYLLRATRGA